MANKTKSDPLEAAKGAALSTTPSIEDALETPRSEQPELLPVEEEMKAAPSASPALIASVKIPRYRVEEDKKISYRGVMIVLRKGDIISDEMGTMFVSSAQDWRVNMTKVE